MQIIWLLLAGVVAATILSLRYPREAGWLAAAVSLIAAIMGFRLLGQDVPGRIELFTSWMELFSLDVSFYFDPLSTLTICLIGMVGVVAALACIERAGHFVPPLLLLAELAAIVTVLAGETLSFSAASLVLALVLAVIMLAKGQHGPALHFFYTVGGASGLFLAASAYLGVGLGVTSFAQTNISDMVTVLPRSEWVFAAVACTIVAWCAWVPLHTWATSASRFLSPASDAWLLVLPPLVGLYLFLRTWPVMSQIQPEIPVAVLPAIGAMTVLLASYAALHQQSLRRVAAFVALAQLGFVPMGMETYFFEGAASSLLHMVAFAIAAPLLFLSLARLSEALSRPEGQEPVSFWLAVAGVVTGVAVPTTVGFLARQMLIRALLERPGSSLFYLLATVIGSAFITLALAGVLYRTIRAGVTMGKAEAPLDDMLMRPAVAALAIPLVLALLLGTLQSAVDGIIYAPTSVLGVLLPSVAANVRASVWATLLALAGPGVGLLLYASNEDCAQWRVKVLGIQQCPAVIPQRWWSYLEKADPYQGARLLVVLVVDSLGKAVEVVGERLAR